MNKYNPLKLAFLYAASALMLAAFIPAVSADSAESDPMLVDPTLPNWFGLTKTKKKSSSLVLNSLVTGSQRRLAVINGELMREGDTHKGFTLDQILEDRVLITRKSGKKQVLKLKNAKISAKALKGKKR